jgi:hypothetical protein
VGEEEKKDEGMDISVAIMIIGAIFFIYTLFVGSDNSSNSFLSSNFSSTETSSSSNVNSFSNLIYLPPLDLEYKIRRDLVASIPYVYLEGDLSYKDFSFPLERNYDYLEAFYEIKEKNNAVLGVYINNIMVSFNKEGNNYYKYIEKPVFQNSNILKVRFVIKKEGFFGTPKVVIKDFVIYGYKNEGKKIVEFSLDKEDIKNYELIGEPSYCKPGSLILKVNKCPDYIINFNCQKRIELLIPEICFQENNKIIFELQSGKLFFKKLYLKETN